MTAHVVRGKDNDTRPAAFQLSDQDRSWYESPPHCGILRESRSRQEILGMVRLSHGQRALHSVRQGSKRFLSAGNVGGRSPPETWHRGRDPRPLRSAGHVMTDTGNTPAADTSNGSAAARLLPAESSAALTINPHPNLPTGMKAQAVSRQWLSMRPRIRSGNAACARSHRVAI